MQKIGAVMMEQMAINAPTAGNRMNTKGTSFDSVMSTAGNAAGKGSKDVNVIRPAKANASGDGSQYSQAQQKVQDALDGTVSQDVSAGTGNVSQDKVLTDETVSAVEEVVSETVKSVTGLDDAALEDAMSALSLTFIDLLNPENLQQLIVYVNGGTDVTDMLTSDVMMSQFNEILSGLSELDWSDLAGMSKDEFLDSANMMMEYLQDGELADELMQASDTAVSGQEDRVQDGVSTQQFAVSQDNAEGDVNAVEVVANDGSDVKPVAENMADAANSGMSEGSFGGAQTETVSVKTETEVETAVVNGQFAQEFTQTVTEVKQTAQPNVPQVQQMIDIVNQVVERIRVTLNTDNTTMEMQLNPESLGKVYLSVAAKDGVMTASFLVQSEEAKAALESQMVTLRENLEQKELKVEAVEVTVSDFDFEQSNQADTQDQKEYSKGSGKQFMYDAEEGEDSEQAAASEAEAVRRQVMPGIGSSVDLSA